MNVGSHFKPSVGGGMISIQSSSSDLQAFQEFAKLLPKAAAAANRRAINKTLGWLRGKIARAVSQQQRVALAGVRQRLRSYPVSGGAMSGKLWFGLNAIESSRIGRARQTRSGVSVAGRRYQGAFLKKVYGNQPDIWIRTASKHFNPDDYPDSTVNARGGASSGWIAENDSRFPLAKAKVSLEQARPHFESWVRKADERLLQILQQELNFELQKYLKGK
jgi:hypothetical protein